LREALDRCDRVASPVGLGHLKRRAIFVRGAQVTVFSDVDDTITAHWDHFTLACRGAAVSVGGISIVTLLGALEGSVAAGFGGAGSGAAIACRGVTIVAAFAAIGDSIPASWRRGRFYYARSGAAVSICGVSIVAGFRALNETVAAGLDEADGRAPVASRGVAIVAFFTGVEAAITAGGRGRLDGTGRRTPITVDGVPVITGLGTFTGSVAAGLDAAGGGAAIACHGVTVVAAFATVDRAVSAYRRRGFRSARSRASIAGDGVPVIAFLCALEDPVAAAFRGAGHRATVAGGCVSIIAFFGRIKASIATEVRGRF